MIKRALNNLLNNFSNIHRVEYTKTKLLIFYSLEYILKTIISEYYTSLF